MNDPIVISTVTSRRDRKRFQNLPWMIYGATRRSARGGPRDPNWVPPLLAQERQLLGWGRHAFYENAEIITLLAERDGEVVGRLAVFVNHIHNRKYNDRCGFFGFFECVDALEVARAMFDAGDRWLREQGMTTVRGPVNPSLNYTCGLLIDGVNQPPRFLMPYNPPYYAALLEACGFVKSQDMYAYEMDTSLLASITERYKPAVVAAMEQSNLVIRPFNPRNYQAELAIYLDIYNRALEGTWGFTPLQPSEARQIARDIRHVITPEFVAFAEVDGKPVGAVLALLDYNQILRKLNGRLFPFGFLRLLAGRRRISAARCMAMTMVPGYQGAGLAIVLMDHLVMAAKQWGDAGGRIEGYEFSWVLESNTRSRGTLERLKTRVTSTYRIYEKSCDAAEIDEKANRVSV